MTFSKGPPETLQNQENRFMDSSTDCDSQARPSISAQYIPPMQTACSLYCRAPHARYKATLFGEPPVISSTPPMDASTALTRASISDLQRAIRLKMSSMSWNQFAARDL